jgi:hypothetical protein
MKKEAKIHKCSEVHQSKSFTISSYFLISLIGILALIQQISYCEHNIKVR